MFMGGSPLIRYRLSASAVARIFRGVGVGVLLFCSPGSWFHVRTAEKTETSLSSQSFKNITAAHLPHFAKLTTFPESKPPVLSNAGIAEFRVVIIGEDPFGVLLDKVFGESAVPGRSLSIQRLPADATIPECHMVYFGKMDADRQSALLKSLHGKATLTLGVGNPFFEAGMVRFREEDAKVVFDVHLERVLAAGLHLDSRVLRLAKVVNRPK